MSDIERAMKTIDRWSRHLDKLEPETVGDAVDIDMHRDDLEHLRGVVQAARQAPANGEVEPVITNEMKAECMGEFSFMLDVPCGECLVEGEDEDCEVCGGELTHQRAVTVPWDLCKKIYKRMARIAPAHPPAKVPEEWNLVEHPTCYQLHRGNEIVAVLAGPDTEANAEKLKALLTTPTPVTTPQPAQQGSVPDLVRLCLEGAISLLWASNWRTASGRSDLEALLKNALACCTPQPEGDGWIKCSERLPTNSDADFEGKVWIFDTATMSWFRGNYGEVCLPRDSHWKPTGLNRPQPPVEQEGE